jgi:hypothetical protein
MAELDYSSYKVNLNEDVEAKEGNPTAESSEGWAGPKGTTPKAEPFSESATKEPTSDPALAPGDPPDLNKAGQDADKELKSTRQNESSSKL